MHESTELQAITSERLVRCKVLRPFRPGGIVQDAEYHVGDVVRLAAPVALQNAQEGFVKVERDKAGKVITDPNPDFTPPPPVETARIRILIPSRHHPVGEPATRDVAVGKVATVKLTRARYACSGSNPAAEFAA